MTAARRNATSRDHDDELVARFREMHAGTRFKAPTKPMSKEQRRAFRWCLAWMQRHGTTIPGSEKVLKGKT